MSSESQDISVPALRLIRTISSRDWDQSKITMFLENLPEIKVKEVSDWTFLIVSDPENDPCSVIEITMYKDEVVTKNRVPFVDTTLLACIFGGSFATKQVYIEVDTCRRAVNMLETYLIDLDPFVLTHELVSWVGSDELYLLYGKPCDNALLSSLIEKGYLLLVQWLATRLELGSIDGNTALKTACQFGRLEILKWLWHNVPVSDLNDVMDSCFRLCCENGHLEMAKWLWTNLCLPDDADLFKSACDNGHLPSDWKN